MSWGAQSSRRGGALPPSWPAIRLAVLSRDGRRCQLRGPRCLGAADQVDHIGDPQNHSAANLRAACRPCHMGRTARQAHAARPSRLRPIEDPRPPRLR